MDSMFDLASGLGLWIGFLLSLLMFSRIFGDHLLARLAQYLLVGASLGYLVVLVLQNVLRPRLLQPLLDNPTADLWLYVPLALGLILCIAGLERIVQQARPGRQGSTAPSTFRRALAALGMIPIALLLGTAIATAIVGTIQGTLLPQFLEAARSGIPRGGTNGQLFTGVVTLLVTTGALLHLYVDPSEALSAARSDTGKRVVSGRIVRGLLWLWMWAGKRALWLAAGMIFARLIASRLSLLIARFEYFYQVIEGAGLW